MINRLSILLILGCLLALWSCEEAIDWELSPGENGQLVVEAILTDELKQQEVRLSLSFNELNSPPPSIMDAIIHVEANNVIYEFELDSLSPGLYKSKAAFAVLANLDYQLNIQWNDNEYLAISSLSEVAPIPDIPFDRSDSTGLLSFNEGPFLYNPNQQAMYDMLIDWSHLGNSSPSRAQFIFYTFNTLEESQLVRPRQEEVEFPVGSIVNLRKLGLNDDFAAYLRALAIETEWNGGLYYSFPASLPSNISGGALGFFSTCAVETRSFIAR